MSTAQDFSSPPILVQKDYLRERLDPRPGDPAYLHLRDLRLALGEAITTLQAPRVLDYGCGGSPYRSLFSPTAYHRADIPGTPGLDYEFDEESHVAAPNDSYDCVLSTQVLEHVRRPERYLAECFRLLAPGGRLLLSTHGIYEEHGCPHDFQRWTSDGLRLAVENAGFDVKRLRKLTGGARAVFFIVRSHTAQLVTGDRTPATWLLRAGQWLFRQHARAIDVYCDRAFPATQSIFDVSPDQRGPTIYIALLIEARKPLNSR
jgi:SAM-dependent methyltransferase